MSTPLDYADSIWNAGHLWQNGLAAVPVALIVAAICRWAPCRPATRHLLWLVVLLVFLVPQTWLGEKAQEAATSAAAWTRDHATAAWTKTSEWVAAKSDCKTECDPCDTTCDKSVTEVASAEIAGPAITTGSSPRSAASRAEPGVPRPEPRARPLALKAPNAHVLQTQPGAVDARPDRPVTTFRPAPANLPEPESGDAESPVCDADASASPCDEKSEGESTLEQPAVDVALCPTDQPCTDAPQEEDDDTPAGVVTTLSAPIEADHQFVSKLEFVAPTGAEPFDKPKPREAAVSTERLWGPRIIAVRDAIVALPPIPSAIWAGGVAALVVAAMIRTLVQGRMLRRATAAPADVRRMVASAAATLGLAHPPETRMVPDRISPMVWCGLKRRLLLPKELWAELDEVSRSAVIMHELAHLRRKDHWTCWAELIACAVYWWHPVVWWVRRRLREEADLCCDAWVTALFPMERRVYAQALLETRKYISRSRWSEPAVGLSATAGGAKRFARRLTMVMTQRNKPGGSWTGVALAAILAGAGLATGPIWACPPEEEKHATPAPAAPVALTAAVAPTPRPADIATPAEAPSDPPMALMALLAAQPEQPDSTFERHMATRERSAARSHDLEALLEAAGERLDALDARLDGLRDLLESAGESEEGSEAAEAACAAGQAECEAMAAECEAACKAASEAQADEADDDSDDDGDECTPSRDKAASHGHGHSMNGGFDATVNGRALVLIVSGDGQVQVYRVPEDRTESLISMLDAAGGPVVVQQGGRVAVNGADVNALVAGEVRERVARSRQAQQEIRAAQRVRINTTTEAYRRQVEAYQRSAEDMQRKAEEMERQAEEMDSKAQSMNDEASSLPRSERRRVEADAQRFSRQTEQMRQAAESMNQQAEQLMQQAEELASQAEAMREQAEAEAEAAAEQAEAEAANDDAPDADLWDVADDVAPEEDVTEPAYHEDPAVGYAR